MEGAGHGHSGLSETLRQYAAGERHGCLHGTLTMLASFLTDGSSIYWG